MRFEILRRPLAQRKPGRVDEGEAGALLFTASKCFDLSDDHVDGAAPCKVMVLKDTSVLLGTIVGIEGNEAAALTFFCGEFVSFLVEVVPVADDRFELVFTGPVFDVDFNFFHRLVVEAERRDAVLGSEVALSYVVACGEHIAVMSFVVFGDREADSSEAMFTEFAHGQANIEHLVGEDSVKFKLFGQYVNFNYGVVVPVHLKV